MLRDSGIGKSGSCTAPDCPIRRHLARAERQLWRLDIG